MIRFTVELLRSPIWGQLWSLGDESTGDSLVTEGTSVDCHPSDPLSSHLLPSLLSQIHPQPGLTGSSFSHSFFPITSLGKWAKFIVNTTSFPLESKAEDRIVFFELWNILDIQKGIEKSIINSLVLLPSLGNKTLWTLLKSLHVPLWSYSPPSKRETLSWNWDYYSSACLYTFTVYIYT